MKEVADVHGEVTFTESGRVIHPAPEGATIPDGALERLDAEKRALCADFRRKLSDLLNREAGLLGLKPSYHEIEIYY